jgi:hypothetical protein
MTPTLQIAAALALLSASPSGEWRSFSVPTHSALQLRLPSSWKETLSQPPGGLPPTIVFVGPKTTFKLSITVLWSPNGQADFNAPDKLLALVEAFGKQLATSSVEGRATLQELKRGKAVAGYCFTITDKEPKPGEFEYLTQGAVALDELELGFTFLSHKKESPELMTALEGLLGAKH